MKIRNVDELPTAPAKRRSIEQCTIDASIDQWRVRHSMNACGKMDIF